MFAARSPIGVAGLAMVLLVRETTGSYATAGAVAAAYPVGIGVSAPFLGRAIDRRGARAMLPLLAVLNAAALAALFPLAELGAPAVVLVLVALAAGLALPPIGSVLRRIWPEVVEPRLLTAAYALDSVAPRDALTEAFTWPITTLLAGVAIGNAASGAIVESHGWRESFLAAALVGAAGVVIVSLRRATLVPAAEARSAAEPGPAPQR